MVRVLLLLVVATLPAAAFPTAAAAVKETKAISAKGTDPTQTDNTVVVDKHRVGNWGGTCTCPNGQSYDVGDYYDSCGAKGLACIGGTAGTCSEKAPSDHTNWGREVTCAPAAPTCPTEATSCTDEVKKSGCVTIPDSETTIGSSAFSPRGSGCEGLTSVTISDSVTSIGGQAFYAIPGLTSLTIPDSVTTIGSDAFAVEGDSTSLTSVTIGNSVTSIGSQVFYGCKSLTSLTLPDSLTDIGGEAFGGVPGYNGF